MKRPLILVTNDDGIDSPGISALALAMAELGEVVIAAPDRQQSAVGHALTVAQPLRVNRFKREDNLVGYAINGTPADCVKLALSTILKRKPDLVISGINHGHNTSVNILYSGTVSAATEGMLLGIPSIAISLASYDIASKCEAAAIYSKIIARKILEGNPLPHGTLLNVNIPALTYEDIKGIKITRHSNSYWDDFYEKRTDPFGRDYYWFSGIYKITDDGNDSDDVAIMDGYVSITPIHFDFTNHNFKNELDSIFGKQK
jgi:5'-nucleotidase